MRLRSLRFLALAPLLLVGGLLTAVFTNGGFESGDFTSWTKSTYLNSGGLTGAPPYTGASITRAAGGIDQTIAVTAASPETGVDPVLGATASLKFPKFGLYSARVNGTTPNYVSNTIKQQSAVTAGDVDSADSKIHVRFVYAPVLENPGHPDNQQPYFYVALRNVTRGNALLYETLNFSNQPGAPWKTSPVNSGVLYSDWQIVDIAPPANQLAVGDTVEIEVTGAGCSQSGHYGYVYVDGFGGQIPGLSVTKVANPDPVQPGSTLTYTFTYRNTGSTSVDNVRVQETVPTNTTFVSVSNTTACSQASGVVTCNFGTMAPGSSGTFQVAVAVASTATVAINNGNYSIEGDGVPPTFGPLVTTPINPLPQYVIPTLSFWGMLGMGLALLGVGLLAIRRLL